MAQSTIGAQNLSENEIEQYNRISLAAYTAFELQLVVVNSSLQIAVSILGLFSSIFTMATICKNAHFAEPCFICYQAIAVSEFFYAIINILYYWSEVVPSASADYTYIWLDAILGRPLATCCENMTFVLVVFLSLQRAVACLIPTKYHLVSTQTICLSVVIVSSCVSAVYAAPELFAYNVVWVNATDCYDYEDSLFRNGAFYQAYEHYVRNVVRIAQAAAVFMSSLLAIIGILQATQLK